MTPEQRKHRCWELLIEAQKMDCAEYLRAMHDSTKRPWVGLTSVDWNDFNAVKSNDPQYVAQWAEAKLKEKNT